MPTGGPHPTALSPEAPRWPAPPLPDSPTARDGSGARGVEPAVHVDDLARRLREPLREESDDGTGDGRGVGHVPTKGRPAVPDVLELGKAGDRSRRHRPHRSCCDEVDPDVAGTEVTGEVAGEGLERRLGHSHPVVTGPCHRRVEIETDDRATAAALLEQGGEGAGEEL